jgi:hypothetical protein
MAEDFDSEDEKESGSSLRKKLEAALKERDEALKVAIASKAQVLIGEKGYKHLTAEDLAGVSLSDLEAKADELEAQKAAADAAALRRVLEAKGFKDSELDQAMKGLLGDEPDQNATQDRIRDAARLQGTPPPQIQDKGLMGRDLLYAAYAQK